MRGYSKVCILIFGLLYLETQGQGFEYEPISQGQYVTHPYFHLSYLEQHEQPEWVAYRLTPEMLRKVVERKDSFREDALVPTKSASYADYQAFKLYDAGHLLSCRNMQFECEAMASTFVMSNMSPQQSYFNRYVWAKLERLERNLAWRYNGLFVISGPVLHDSLPTIGVTSQISVPAYYYKVFIRKSQDGIDAIGFLLANKKQKKKCKDWVVTIDQLEALTGIDFLAQLPDSLENTLEETNRLPFWNLTNKRNNFGYKKATIPCNK